MACESFNCSLKTKKKQKDNVIFKRNESTVQEFFHCILLKKKSNCPLLNFRMTNKS
jgi:hypothetical protein